MKENIRNSDQNLQDFLRSNKLDLKQLLEFSVPEIENMSGMTAHLLIEIIRLKKEKTTNP